MRIFKNRWFAKFAKKEKISDDALFKAIQEANEGNIAGDLGGSVIKQRLPKNGKGKSGGYRTIIIFKKGDKAFFVYGFSKNDRENITDEELDGFKDLSKSLLSLSDIQIMELIEKDTLQEINHD